MPDTPQGEAGLPATAVSDSPPKPAEPHALGPEAETQGTAGECPAPSDPHAPESVPGTAPGTAPESQATGGACREQPDLIASESAAGRWQKLAEIARITNPWLTLIGERLRDAGGQTLDYWRTEVDDSLIVVVEGDGMLWLPAPQYRPGVGAQTLDFAGGRCARDADQKARAEAILARELGVAREQVETLEPLIETPLAVNSSTSNQRLWGWLAKLKPGVRPGNADARSFACDAAGVARLYAALDCLQCRVLWLEYARQTGRC